jgi:hypothetical protein
MSDTQAELSDAVPAILRGLAELSAAQAALDLDPERATAPRDYAMNKTVAAFRQFEAGAKSIKGPLSITIRLTPDSMPPIATESLHRNEPSLRATNSGLLHRR